MGRVRKFGIRVARGATYFDTTALTVGHDVCAAPADRHIEGILPASVATPGLRNRR